MTQPVIQIQGLGKRYRLNRKAFWALRNITLDIHRGDVLGIVGRNGAGKTTLLRVLGRITDPTEGRAVVRGSVGTLLETGTGFHDDLSGRENIYLNGAILGMKPQEINRKLDEIIEFSGVGKFIDSRVKAYSSGMRSRLAFSVAAHLETEVLLVDEVLAVGDLGFQEKCLKKMDQLIKGEERTILFVSHSMGAVQSLCNRAILIENGESVLEGDTQTVIEGYHKLMANGGGTESLARHVGRPGTGEIRIVNMRIEDLEGHPRGHIQAGDGVRLLFDYQSKLIEKPRDVQLGLVFVGTRGVRLFGTPSEVLRSDLAHVRAAGTFACTIQKLPLLPGRYDLVVSVLVDRNLSDKLTNICQLSVIESDYYGSGRLQQNNYGDVLIDFAWHLENGAAIG
jgi:lipopolysaccharide transport system ATP-binding protein